MRYQALHVQSFKYRSISRLISSVMQYTYHRCQAVDYVSRAVAEVETKFRYSYRSCNLHNHDRLLIGIITLTRAEKATDHALNFKQKNSLLLDFYCQNCNAS